MISSFIFQLYYFKLFLLPFFIVWNDIFCFIPDGKAFAAQPGLQSGHFVPIEALFIGGSFLLKW